MDVPSISSIVSQFPDYPFPNPMDPDGWWGTMEYQFQMDASNYVTSNDQSALDSMYTTIASLSTLTGSCVAYNLNLAFHMPNLNNDSNAPGILEYLIETDLESATLQGQLDTIEANVNHLESKTKADIPIIIFYAYTTMTILLGIISICLITYVVYVYMNPSSDSVGGGILSGGGRKR
jgi:hypothetical protein